MTGAIPAPGNVTVEVEVEVEVQQLMDQLTWSKMLSTVFWLSALVCSFTICRILSDFLANSHDTGDQDRMAKIAKYCRYKDQVTR